MNKTEMVENLKRFAKKYAPRVGIFLLATVLTAYLLYHALDMSAVRVDTTHAVESTEYEIAGLTGYVFRDEHIVTSSNGGAAVYQVSNGEKVARNTELARVYTTGNTDEYVARRSSLEDEIELIKKSIEMKSAAASISKTRAAMDKAYQELMKNLADGNSVAAKKSAEDLAVYLNAYDYVLGKLDLDSALAEKQAELEALGNSYGGSFESVGNSDGGYFYYGYDGYENIFDYSAVESLTATTLAAIVSEMEKIEKTSDVNVIGRMIYDFEWYLATPATKELCEKLRESAKYKLDFTHSKLELKMTLERIVIAPGDEEGLLIFSSGMLPEDFDFERVQGIELLVDTTEGYRVPKEALREERGFKGVYILASSKIEFRRVNILLETDDYYVVAERDLDTENYEEFLDLNDEIIISISDGELYEGRMLN